MRKLLTLELIFLLIPIITINALISVAKGNGKIYIKADGSIDPPTAPIRRIDNVYTLISDVYCSIIIERDNIVIDGAGHAIRGTGGRKEVYGIYLSGRLNVTIENVRIENFIFGIFLNYSSNINICGNIIGNCISGVHLNNSLNNVISKNDIENNPFGIVLWYSSNNDVIGNYIVKGCTGIRIYSSSYNNIIENNIASTQFAIFLESSSRHNNVSRNNMFSNCEGIMIGHSSNNLIGRNTINDSLRYGIRLCNALNNVIDRNDVKNCGTGIYLYHNSDNNTIRRNSLTMHAHEAINLERSSNNFILKNVIRSNDLYGIELESSSNNVIIGNIVEGNTFGICLDSSLHHKPSSGNIICENNVTNNRVGIRIHFLCSHNIIYHNNFVNNTMQVSNHLPARNIWDDGYPSGGNYWSDYNGTDERKGPNQNQPGSDGIGDTPYVIDENNRDRYPLIKHVTISPPITRLKIDLIAPPNNAKVSPPIIFRVRITSNGKPVEGALVTFYRGNDENACISQVKTNSEGYAEVRWNPKWRQGKTFVWWAEVMKEEYESSISEKRTLIYVPSPLYEKILLEVPYEHQGNAQWCGPASLAMVLRYYGINVHVWDVASDLSLSKRSGTSIPILKNYVDRYYQQLNTRIGVYHSINEQIRKDICSNISSGYPIILALFKPTWNWHFVVVTGFNSTGFFINDPYGTLFYWLWGEIPYSNINVYVSWEEIRQYIVTGTLGETFLVIEGVPSPSSATISIAHPIGLNSLVWTMHETDTTKGVYIDFEKGLIWQPKGGHMLALDPHDKLHISFFVYNHKDYEQTFKARIKIMGVVDKKVYYSLTSDYIIVKQFNYSLETSLFPDITVKDILTKDQPYIITLELLDTNENVMDRVILPELFYSSTGILLQLQEAQHKLHLHVYDSKGRHVGINYENNKTEIEIPGAYYYDNLNGTVFVYVPSNMNSFRIIVDSRYALQEVEKYNLTIINVNNGQVLDRFYRQGNIQRGSTQEYYVKITENSRIVVITVPQWQKHWYISIGVVVLALVLILYVYLKKRRQPHTVNNQCNYQDYKRR